MKKVAVLMLLVATAVSAFGLLDARALEVIDLLSEPGELTREEAKEEAVRVVEALGFARDPEKAVDSCKDWLPIEEIAARFAWQPLRVEYLKRDKYGYWMGYTDFVWYWPPSFRPAELSDRWLFSVGVFTSGGRFFTWTYKRWPETHTIAEDYEHIVAWEEPDLYTPTPLPDYYDTYVEEKRIDRLELDYAIDELVDKMEDAVRRGIKAEAGE